MKAMINEVVIHGVKYKAVDNEREQVDFTCKDCDIYKAKKPQNPWQLPLCCEDKYKKVNDSCCEQFDNGMKRIWKQV